MLTLEREGEIYDQLSGDNCKGEVVLFYRNTDDDDWHRVEDTDEVAGVQWGGKLRNSKPGAFIRTPVAKEISFSVINRNGEYCPESSSPKAGVLKDGTRIKIQAGYLLNTEAPMRRITADLELCDLFHTVYNAGEIYPDPSTPLSDPKSFKDLFATKYDSVPYGSEDYTPSGAAVIRYDLEGRGYTRIGRIAVEANFTEGRIFARTLDAVEYGEEIQFNSTNWTEIGDTVDGTVSFLTTLPIRRWVEVAVLWDGTDWDPSRKLLGIELEAHDRVQWIYDQIYRLDEPSYTDPESPAIATVNCNGYDAIGRAIETDFNFPDLSAGYTIDELLKMVFNACGMRYTSTSIPSLATYGTKSFNPLTGPVKAIEVIEMLLELLLRESGAAFELFTLYDESVDDDVVFLRSRPSEYFAPFVLSYKRYQSIGARRINRGNLLQRVTSHSGDLSVLSEELLDSETGYTTEGTLTLSWAFDALYKRVKITTNSGTPSVTLVSVAHQSVVLSITGTFNIDVEIYGCEIDSYPAASAEWFGIDAMLEGRGYTHVIQNGFIDDDAEALTIAKGYAEEYGDPAWEIGNCRWPYLNLVLDTNDPAMIWSRSTFNDTIHRVTGIRHQWSRSDNPNDSTQLDLQDTGLDYFDQGLIVYDRSRAPIGDEAVRHDFGYLYDMRFGVLGTLADAPESSYDYKDVSEA
jgi:hypothetical protein